MKLLACGALVTFCGLTLFAFAPRPSWSSIAGRERARWLAGVPINGGSSVSSPSRFRAADESALSAHLTPDQRGHRDATSTERSVPLDTLICPGIVWRARYYARCPVQGMIASVAVREGQVVEARATLAKIDDTAASLDLARQQARRRQLLSEVREAEASLAIAQDECRRAKSLAEKRAVSQQSLVVARLVVTTREARRDALREQLAAEETLVSLLEHRRAEHFILASTAGRIVEIHRHAATFVLAGEPLAVIEVLEPYVRLHLPTNLCDCGELEAQVYWGTQWFDLPLVCVKPGVNDDGSQTCLLHVPDEMTVECGQILQVHLRPKEVDQ